MRTYLCIGLFVLGACAAKEQPAPPAEPAMAMPSTQVQVSPSGATLTRIADRSTVCMVNDRDMGAPQIPVVVDGKTYYGCCKMCEKRLHEDESVRSATDPVSHQKVDKALALLARDTSGNVLYFADESSLASKIGRP
jgi:YHS domain-containing protein